MRLQHAPLSIFTVLGNRGILGADMMFKVSNNLTVGPSINFARLSGEQIRENSKGNQFGKDVLNESFQMGLRVDLVLNEDLLNDRKVNNGPFTDAFYISNILNYSTFNTYESLNTETNAKGDKLNEGTALTGGAIIGRQFFWKNGFNTNIGLGYIQTKILEEKDSYKGPLSSPLNRVWIDFGIGYTV